jgi:hypothetical protein
MIDMWLSTSATNSFRLASAIVEAGTALFTA